MSNDNICPVCGGEFFVGMFHHYRKAGKNYCSFECFTRRESREVSGKNKPIFVSTREGFVGEFQTAQCAAEYIGCTIDTVYCAIRTGKPIFKRFICEHKG